jgi:hypothetical protein
LGQSGPGSDEVFLQVKRVQESPANLQ